MGLLIKNRCQTKSIYNYIFSFKISYYKVLQLSLCFFILSYTTNAISFVELKPRVVLMPLQPMTVIKLDVHRPPSMNQEYLLLN